MIAEAGSSGDEISMISRVQVNARFMTHQVTGVERYAHEIVKRLSEQVHLIQVPGRLFSNPVMGHCWEQICLPRRVRAGNLLWSPANSGPLVVAEQVVTIHDTGPIDHPEWFKPVFAYWYRWLLRFLVHRVRAIITPSEFSKSRLVDNFGISQGRVTAIPLGVDHQRFYPLPMESVYAARVKYGLPNRYVLHVGTLSPRKNLPRLFRAWEMVVSSCPDTTLVLIGLPAHTLQEEPVPVVQPGLRFLGRVADQDLPALYAGAEILIMPSLYEGFGLPVLEAMACGTTVITSNRTALPEVAGSAAILVDPLSVDQIATALHSLIVDEKRRDAHSQKGLERAAHFSWDQTADAVWRVLAVSASKIER